MNPFERRMQEVGVWRTPIEVSDLWVLICRAQAVSGGAPWLSEWLWRYRVASWVASTKNGSCEACGASLARRRGDARYCDEACAQQARRSRKKGHRTPHQRRVERAAGDLRTLDDQLDGFRKWRSSMRAFVLPLDLLGVQNLPSLPRRCGGGCTAKAKCSHTGGVCLFAGTRGMHD